MTVYCLFLPWVDSDNHIHYHLFDVYDSSQKAIFEAKKQWNEDDKYDNPEFAHKTMSIKKPYYIGKRRNCKLICENIGGNIEGFVIEKRDVK